MGFKTYTKKITLKDKDYNAGTIKLEPDAIMLKGATVTARAQKVTLKADTFVYNANAFRTPEGSVAEELVRRLPGAEISDDGTIKINGKQVKKILVDGKEFMTGDTKTAMKNLPTNIIDRIKAYDQQSDLARVSGIEDGEEETVLDFGIKAGMNRGVMANADHMPPAAERGDFLPRAVKTALKTLDNAENGFFLMVEGSQIDFACHGNDSAWMVNEVVDFSQAIQIALDYAEEHGNTLVVVTADHETGGLTMPDPKGKYTNVVFNYSTGSHTCLPVMVYAYGPGAEQFTGWMQNTAIKGKILNACGMENIGDGLPEVDGTNSKAVKVNLDSKPEK